MQQFLGYSVLARVSNSKFVPMPGPYLLIKDVFLTLTKNTSILPRLVHVNELASEFKIKGKEEICRNVMK